ncbi:MAG: crotonyl-CoA carboxylase/reductase [Deltaproteobacteria bacterium]|nr:crotonyl-CoA carboxylase/reductase [Deltaproteobacteria bacterium]
MTKAIYDIGTLPPLGEVPERMHASVIRRERFGSPAHAFQSEEIPVPRLGHRQVMVYVMAAGINYNNVWAALGQPVDVISARQKRGEPEAYHIGGSEASGIVWAVGRGATGVAVGDRVVVSSCRWDEHAADIRRGRDPMASDSQSVWGYEENFGSFAQFTVVEDYQLHAKPANLSWEAAAAYMLTGATAYRQLTHFAPHTVQPGDPVLIWGGAGGLGSMAIQIVSAFGGHPVAVVSDDDKAEYCRRLGAVGTINRSDFSHWGRFPDIDDSAALDDWMLGARAFGKAFWDALGERRNPRIVFEHSGQGTVPTSVYVCDTDGMIVICGGTSGYNADVDLRFLWMRQKRLQGSHFANTQECAAITELVARRIVDPCLSTVAPFAQVGNLHQLMHDNEHPPGNMAVLVNATEPGQQDIDL